MKNMDLVNAALNFAARAHDGQRRKGSLTPYIVHPVGVMLLLMDAGENSPELLAAALLHDTIEDAGVSREEVQQRFGRRVADIVAGCTEPNRNSPWEVRKKHTVEFLRTAPREVLLVAAADKLHNLYSIAADFAEEGEEVWKRFRRGRAEMGWYYRAIASSLETGGLAGHPLMTRLKSAIDEFFGPAIA